MRDCDDSCPLISQGIWKGRIAYSPKGQNGFGYDPVFIDLNSTKTAAQLNPDRKLTLSHRGKALRELSKQLSRITKL